MIYSYNNQYPKPLPSRLKLPDGTTRTDPASFTPEEIALAGYVAAEDYPTVVYPNKLEWTGTSWLVRPPNNSETQQQIRQVQEHCKQMLFNTDYKIIKAFEQGVSIDPEFAAYRQQLRDLYNNVADPWFVIWPTLEIAQEETVEIPATDHELETLEKTEPTDSSNNSDIVE
jgi:hypothetical protein